MTLALKQAILANPADASLHVALGRDFYASGDWAEAEKCARRALYFDAENADAAQLLAAALFRAGRAMEAFAPALQALGRRWDRLEARELYAQIVTQLPPRQEENLARPALEQAMALIPPVPITDALRAALTRLMLPKPEILTPPAFDATALERLADPLLFALLRRSLIVSVPLELFIAPLRRALLLAPDLRHTPAAKPWLEALWEQGFRNEYIMAEGIEETAALDALLAARPQGWEDIALIGSYRPLVDLPFTHSLKDPRMQEQVTEILTERALALQIVSFTAIEDTTSRKVQAQYEENPYPRWTEINPAQPLTLPEYLRLRVKSLSGPLPEFPTKPQVLIAGCGTGKHACSVALPLQNCDVTAIDLSRASLAYATKKARALGLNHLKFLHGDLLRVSELGQRFDLIESSGVLHHMRDPLEGWRALVDVLAPGGFMKVALYSRTARRFLLETREAIAHEGLSGAPAEIRRWRAERLAEGITPANARIFLYKDFFSTSECRDLLFHVQEHNTDLPEIQASLEALGLEFLGFEFTDFAASEAYRRAHPQDSQALSLENWHAWEQNRPDTFRNMYQFWLRKK